MPDFTLSTKRLMLQKVTYNDFEFIYALVNTPGWLQFIGDRNVHDPASAKLFIKTWAMDRYVKYGYGPYVMVYKENNQPIGICGLFKRDYLEYPDLGFALLPEYNGQGFANEASQAVIQYAFSQLDLPKLYAITATNNFKSGALLQKLGFREIASLVDSADRTFELTH